MKLVNVRSNLIYSFGWIFTLSAEDHRRETQPYIIRDYTIRYEENFSQTDPMQEQPEPLESNTSQVMLHTCDGPHRFTVKQIHINACSNLWIFYKNHTRIVTAAHCRYCDMIVICVCVFMSLNFWAKNVFTEKYDDKQYCERILLVLTI